MPTRIILILLLLLSRAAWAADSPRTVQNFDFDWRFHLGDVPGAEVQGFQDGDWRQLNVPHDFSREGDFSPTNASCTAFLPGGIGWYRKTFAVPSDWQGKLVHIEFDGVCLRSQVWVNGHLLGGWPYAYSTFDLDLTPYLNFDAINVIAVRVDRSIVADSRWYPGSGIERHVRLIATDKIHVAQNGIYITTPDVTADKAQISIQTSVQNETSADTNATVVTEIFDPNGKKILVLKNEAALTANGENNFTQADEIANPKLWSPDSPSLYTASTTVREGDTVVDQIKTRFGIRSAIFDAQRGFVLNGTPVKIKGVCIHDDAGALGCAVPDSVLERRLILLKAMGCNAIRCSHNPKPPEFYDMCDRLGLLVMDEAFDEWASGKNKWIEGWNQGTASHDGYSDFFADWSDRDLREMVMRDRNHPSIILWSIGNEIDYPEDPFSYPTDQNYNPNKPSAKILAQIAPRLAQDVHECDPTRPVTAALANIPASDATGLADTLDVVGYNYQINLYAGDLAKYPNRKFYGSETVMDLSYAELCATNPRVAGQFLWTGIDYLGEAGRWPIHGSPPGLFDTCCFEKPVGYLRESFWSEKPMVYVAVAPPSQRGSYGRGIGALRSHWNWSDDPRKQLPVIAFSNCKTVELFLNGKSLGTKSPADSPNHICRWLVRYQPGELKAVGTSDDGKTIEYSLNTAGKPDHLELITDRKQLASNGEDAANIEVRLVDDKGVLVPNDDVTCSLQVTGAGQLLSVDNGNLFDTTPLSSSSRKLNNGRELAVVESSRSHGSIILKVTAPGLPEATLKLHSEGIL